MSARRFSARDGKSLSVKNLVLKAFSIFSGNANRELAEAICRHLETPLGHAEVTRFADGEIYVEINENVRGVNCFVVQPTSTPVNDNLMELLVMIDALKRASAGSIIAVIPYFGYARQDRKSKPRTPISARLVADLMTVVGGRPRAGDRPARRADPGLLQHPGRPPVRHAGAHRIPEGPGRPGGGDRVAGRRRRRARPRLLQAPGHQPRHHRQAAPSANVAEVVNIIGDVKGRDAIIVDDIIDTAGTLCAAAQAVMDQGARAVYACASHGVLSGAGHRAHQQVAA